MFYFFVTVNADGGVSNVLRTGIQARTFTASLSTKQRHSIKFTHEPKRCSLVCFNRTKKMSKAEKEQAN